MNLRITSRAGRAPADAPSGPPSRRRPPAGARRPALYLSAAAAGAVLLNVLTTGGPAAQAETSPLESVSIAAELGIEQRDEPAPVLQEDTVRPLEQLAASRSERDAEQAAAAQAQAAADQAELDARAAAEAAARAAAEAEAKAAAERAAAEKAAAEQAAAQQAAAARAATAPAPSRTAAPAPAASSGRSGSFRDYALAQLGGNGQQFGCLESLWGKESGWNPNAQNPSSTAYGIPQFLDSTWAGTGIAKTSDGYRQIDAGLIYIEQRYGSPCGAWSHSQANNWY